MAGVDQRGQRDLDTKVLCAGHRKIVVLWRIAADVLGDTYPLPDQESPYRSNLECEPWPAPKRHIAAVPSHPIHEKQNMAPFLAHDRFKGLDQFGRKKTRTLCGFEEAKREEAVDTLAVACDHKGPFRMAGLRVLGFRLQCDAVGLNHVVEYVLVAALLECVQRNRLLQQRVGDLFAIGGDTQAGFAL